MYVVWVGWYCVAVAERNCAKSLWVDLYPHMPIGKVWIYHLLFVCLFVRLRIFLPMIELTASNFARQLIGVQCRESPIFCEICCPEVLNQPACGPHTPLQYIARSRIFMCGYRSVLTDVLVHVLGTLSAKALRFQAVSLECSFIPVVQLPQYLMNHSSSLDETYGK